MALNVKLLRKVKRHILAMPSRFAMNYFVARGKPGVLMTRKYPDGSVNQVFLDGKKRKAPPCGTVGCIAGWAALLTAKDPKRVADNTAETRGRRALGLTRDQASVLFYTYSWPWEMQERYLNAKHPQIRANIAARRIDQFIKEHKRPS